MSSWQRAAAFWIILPVSVPNFEAQLSRLSGIHIYGQIDRGLLASGSRDKS